MNNYKPLLKYNLQFFAGDSSGEKTEKATPKKRQDAKKEGQVVKSQEVNTAAILIVMFFVLKTFIPYISESITILFRETYSKFVISDNVITVEYMSGLISEVLITILKILAPVFVASFITGLLVNYIQVGVNITTKPLKPKFSKLNPVEGFKRLFSLKAIVELIKSILKIVILLVVVNSVIKDNLKTLLVMYDMSLMQIVIWTGNLAIEIGLKIGLCFIFIAGADYLYQKYKHEKDLKMTKQEIKEEYKMSEGNPEIKSKIKQKMREMSMRRMMQDVPKADVIITNPTHFAVAIKYDATVASAPIVLAKGTNIVAAKIKEKAKENKIEIVENKPLARTLYYNVEIGEQVPEELYQAVAEVLAFVYGLKGS